MNGDGLQMRNDEYGLCTTRGNTSLRSKRQLGRPTSITHNIRALENDSQWLAYERMK